MKDKDKINNDDKVCDLFCDCDNCKGGRLDILIDYSDER